MVDMNDAPTDYNKITSDAAADNVSKMNDMIADAAAYLAKLTAARDAWSKVDGPSAWDSAADETKAAQAAKPKHKLAFFEILSDPY